jgi:hypothetical protein
LQNLLLWVCCFVLSGYSINPNLEGTKPVEIVEGQQRKIKPSMKVKAAAGTTPGKGEPGSESEDEGQGSQKCKKLANAKVCIAAPKAPPKKCAKKVVVVESDNESTEDEVECNSRGADEVDAYKCLQEQCKTDQLVSAGTDDSILIYINCCSRKKEITAPKEMTNTRLTSEPSSLQKHTLCQIAQLRRVTGAKYASA